MARRYCAGCGEPLAPGFRICPKCGRVPEAEKPDIRLSAQGGRFAPKQRQSQSRSAAPERRRMDSYAAGDRLTYEPQRRQNDIYSERQRRAESYQQGGYVSNGYDRQYQPQRRQNDIYGERQRRAESYSQGGYGNSSGGVIGSYDRQYQPQRRQNDIYGERQRRAEGYPQENYASDYGYDSGYGYDSYEPPRRQAAPQKAPARPAAKPKKRKGKLAAFLDTSSKVVRVVVNTVKIAILLAVIYAGVFLIEVYRVKMTPYPYTTSMKMSRKNFGQAISAYFPEGHWMVNPFTLKCSYKGKTSHNEDMEIVFGAGINIEISEIIVNGEQLDIRQFESKVMGMFI